MKQYDIEIEEILRRVVSVEANDIEEAYDIVSEQIDNCEIVLTADDYVERDIRNLNSKKLDEKIKIFAMYNPETEHLKILHNDHKEETYVCETVRDITSSIRTYVNDKLEKDEIEAEKEEEQNLEEIEI